MLINHDREKLIAAIAYFAQNTQSCTITKLIKLLYFLDFEHFKQTGRSVTGLSYFAWKLGPVPTALYEELECSPAQDLSEYIKVEATTFAQYPANLIKPLSEPDMRHFSKRETNLIKDLAEKYKNVTATELVKKTHADTLPWHKVYIEEGKPQELIPYEYIIDPINDAHILELAEENKKIKDIYR